MASLPKVLYRGQPPVAAATVTVPAAKQWIVTSVVVSNSTATATTFRIDLAGVRLIPDVTLDPAAVFTMDCTQVLNSGDVLAVKAGTASAISMHISGVEMYVV